MDSTFKQLTDQTILNKYIYYAITYLTCQNLAYFKDTIKTGWFCDWLTHARSNSHFYIYHCLLKNSLQS